MTSCKYTLKNNPGKTVDAKYIGFWSVRWSADQAEAALKAFQRPPLADMAVIQAAAAQPFLSSLILIPLHGAVYWALAAGIPVMSGQIDAETGARALEELRRGRDDSLKDLVLPNGKSMPKELVEPTRKLYDQFYADVLHDLADTLPKDPILGVAGMSRTARTAAATLAANLKTDFPPEQQVVFGQFIDQAVDRLAGHLQHELQVTV